MSEVINDIATKYGILRGVLPKDRYENGVIKECMLEEYNEIKINNDTYVPQYDTSEVRRKYTKSLGFYEDGSIKSISLDKQSKFNTSIGDFPAELVTFYANGSIKKLFPLNGKLSGYWTEENEYDTAEEFEFKFNFGTFKSKVISIEFYDSGEVNNITFWPKDFIKLKTSIGEMEVRIGLSLYKSGNIESIELRRPTLIETQIGSITAYDPNAIGLYGSNNSLKFYENGEIKSLFTSYNTIKVIDDNGLVSIFTPELKPNLFNSDIMDIIPLKIEFVEYDNKVIFGDNLDCKYSIENLNIKIEKFDYNPKNNCSDCESCNACNRP